MRVEVDLEKCQGYGNCAVTAPEVFSVDAASDRVSIKREAVEEVDGEVLREAVRDCPTGALRLVEDMRSGTGRGPD